MSILRPCHELIKLYVGIIYRRRNPDELALATAAEEWAYTMVLCKPNKNRIKNGGWISNKRKNVAVVIRNKRITIFDFEEEEDTCE